MATIEICVPLPEEALSAGHIPLQRAADEMRRLFLVERVRLGTLTPGKAARLAGMSQAEFYTLMAQHGISPFDYDEAELRRELEPLT